MSLELTSKLTFLSGFFVVVFFMYLTFNGRAPRVGPREGASRGSSSPVRALPVCVTLLYTYVEYPIKMFKKMKEICAVSMRDA